MLNTIMDSVRILKRAGDFELRLRIVHSKLEEVLRLQKRNIDKIMEGFRCIEKAFKINCKAQMTMSEQLDEATGMITDHDC